MMNLYNYHTNPSILYGYDKIYDSIHNMMIDALINAIHNDDLPKIADMLNNIEDMTLYGDPGLYPDSDILNNIRNEVYWGVDDMENDYNEWEDWVADRLIQYLESGKLTKEQLKWLNT